MTNQSSSYKSLPHINISQLCAVSHLALLLNWFLEWLCTSWVYSAWRKGCGGTVQHLPVHKGGYKRAGEGLLTTAWSDRMRANGCKLRERRFRLNVRKKFFPVRVVRPWHRLPREAVDANPWKYSRTDWMVWGLSNPVASSPWQGLGQSLSFIPTQAILWFYGRNLSGLERPWIAAVVPKPQLLSKLCSQNSVAMINTTGKKYLF